MIQWIASTYTTLTASVKVNGVFSEPITISNGTRQGCPLLLLLFALTLEPFLSRVRLTTISGDYGWEPLIIKSMLTRMTYSFLCLIRSSPYLTYYKNLDSTEPCQTSKSFSQNLRHGRGAILYTTA